jgi:dynein assembly factor 5
LCQNLGRFVSPDVYIDLIIPQIQTGGGGAVQFLIGSLKVLSNLLKGSNYSKTLIIDHIARVTQLIASKELISNENLGVRIEIALVLNSILEIQSGVFTLDDPVSYSIFYILVHLKSTEGDATVVGYTELLESVQSNTALFLKHLGLENQQLLTAQYFDTIFLEFKNSVCNWTKYSPELRLLSTVAIQAGPFVGERLELFIGLCEELAKHDRDFEVKSSLFAILNKLMENPALTLNSKMELTTWSEQILCKILINNLVWKAGRKAMMMRSFATELFLKFLSSETSEANSIGCLDNGVLQNQLDKRILPNLISNLDEDIQKARNEDLLILSILLSNMDFEAPQFKLLYPELLKRLDDSQDDIRRQALKTLAIFFNNIGRWQNLVKDLAEDDNVATVKDDSQECGYREIRLDTVHWEAMIKGMAIHLDDLNSKIQVRKVLN